VAEVVAGWGSGERVRQCQHSGKLLPYFYSKGIDSNMVAELMGINPADQNSWIVAGMLNSGHSPSPPQSSWSGLQCVYPSAASPCSCCCLPIPVPMWVTEGVVGTEWQW
jgi:hypothetical protein